MRVDCLIFACWVSRYWDVTGFKSRTLGRCYP
ncbi:hypothetical protein SHVI106290_11675 [Shewanella violacea]